MAYNNRVLKLLEEFRMNKSFTDITILVEDERFPAHKLMLRSASEYFRGLFDSGMKEDNEDEVRIEGITSDIFRICLDFIYGKNIIEQTDDIREIDLLLAANMLLLGDLVKEVVKMITSKLTVKTCLAAWKESAVFSCCESWEDCVVDFICKNVENFLEETPLKTVPCKLLEKIFTSNNLCIPSESKLFEMLVEWMEVNEEASHDNFCSLFQLIRLPVMNRDYFRQHVRKYVHLDDCDVCLNYWKQTFLYINGENKIDLKSSQMSPRKIVKFDEKDILVVANNSTEVLKVCDGELQNTGFALPTFPYKTSNESLQTYKGTFYLMGGDDDRRIFKCKPGDVGWEYICRMPNFHNDKGFHSSVFRYGQCICVSGGKVKNEPVSIVDCYNPVKGTWCEFDVLRSIVGKYGSLLVYKKKLFAIGGFDVPQSNVWKYTSTVVSKWNQQPGMNYKRCFHSSIVHDEKIFVVGGKTRDWNNVIVASTTVETYVPGDSSWTMITSLQSARSRCLLICIKDKLFVFGGHETGQRSNYECYNLNTNKWDQSEEKVNSGFVLHQINSPPLVD